MFQIGCLVCLVTILVASLGFYTYGRYFFIIPDDILHVDVNPREAIFEVDDKYLSVALDVSFMRCLFHKFTQNDWEKLEELSNLLSPGYLRFGGTDADRAVFVFNATTTDRDFKNISCEDDLSERELLITGEDWTKLNEFAQRSGLSLIVDLNVLLRRNSTWDESNARMLLEFSGRRGFPLDFQLGNEPNSFLHVFNVSLTGSQLAGDFRALKALLASAEAYRGAKLIGPDVTRPKNLGIPSLEFLAEFLRDGVDAVDAVSWHQYYLNGHTATLNDFLSPETFDLLPAQIEAISRTVRSHSQTMPIWISETGSAHGGGAPALSDRFAASFLWLDKLGVAAQSNMSVVIRQSLFKGYYALIDNDLTPAPDFWISVLYKRLVGRRVLSVKVSEECEEKLIKFYGHCLSPNSSLNGSIVFYGMNLGNETELLVPSGISIAYPIYSFVFSPAFNNLRSRSVLLNGKPLEYGKTTVLDMLNMREEVEFPLEIKPRSIGFWVVKEISESGCRKRDLTNSFPPREMAAV